MEAANGLTKGRMTMPRQITTQGETLDHWQRLHKSLLDNAGELPHLESSRVKLETMIQEVQTLVAEQRIFASRRQEVSRKLQALVSEGRRLADFLKTGIREHYGTRAEKLTEFGLQPFRGRKSAKPQKPEEPTPSPADPTLPKLPKLP